MEGTNLVVETTNDEEATMIIHALIKGGYFLYDEAVDIMEWKKPGGWVQIGASMICSSRTHKSP